MAILVQNFTRWLGRSRKGAPDYIYHRGSLANDRFEPDGTPNEIDVLAERVYRAYEEGEVNLKQERVGPGLWLYIAERR